MTLLGKLLILFNLLAACGFVYLATQDWKGRQTITAAAVRHKLLLVGLPVEGPDTFSADDETPFRIEMAGSTHTETISKKILEGYFQAAPGGDSAAFLSEKGPVPCQLAEVKRVKAKLETSLKDKGEGEKVGLLGAWLIDQSETFEQRQEVQALVAAGNALELERRLLALFDAVINPPATASSDSLTKVMLTDQVLANLKIANVPDTVLLKLPPLKNQEMTQEEMQNKLAPLLADVKDEIERKNYESQIVSYSILSQMAESRNKPLDAGERQIRIAKLLVHLSPDPGWQKRVVIVVGLRRYVGAIAAQAVRFRDMYARLEKLIVTDQRGFLEQEAQLNQIARDRTELANQQSKLKAEKAEELRKEDDFLGQRQTQLRAIQTQLQKIKAEVDELLVKQGNIEASLFEVQREVAITLDEVYELEAKLAARERELLKLSPTP
jgi:hypothetical protein